MLKAELIALLNILSTTDQIFVSRLVEIFSVKWGATICVDQEFQNFHSRGIFTYLRVIQAL